jgi:hypothetical protein
MEEKILPTAEFFAYLADEENRRILTLTGLRIKQKSDAELEALRQRLELLAAYCADLALAREWEAKGNERAAWVFRHRCGLFESELERPF